MKKNNIEKEERCIIEGCERIGRYGKVVNGKLYRYKLCDKHYREKYGLVRSVADSVAANSVANSVAKPPNSVADSHSVADSVADSVASGIKKGWRGTSWDKPEAKVVVEKPREEYKVERISEST